MGGDEGDEGGLKGMCLGGYCFFGAFLSRGTALLHAYGWILYIRAY
jgi:hypothetical protein